MEVATSDASYANLANFTDNFTNLFELIIS